MDLIQPKMVIPCHYNIPALLSRKHACADAVLFKEGVDKLGADCVVMTPGEEIEYGPDLSLSP